MVCIGGFVRWVGGKKPRQERASLPRLYGCNRGLECHFDGGVFAAYDVDARREGAGGVAAAVNEASCEVIDPDEASLRVEEHSVGTADVFGECQFRHAAGGILLQVGEVAPVGSLVVAERTFRNIDRNFVVDGEERVFLQAWRRGCPYGDFLKHETAGECFISDSGHVLGNGEL